jgi:hypothetical protein
LVVGPVKVIEPACTALTSAPIATAAAIVVQGIFMESHPTLYSMEYNVAAMPPKSTDVMPAETIARSRGPTLVAASNGILATKPGLSLTGRICHKADQKGMATFL